MRPRINALYDAGFIGCEAIASELNRRRIAPQRSETWTARSVRNLLNRLVDIAEREAAGIKRKITH